MKSRTLAKTIVRAARTFPAIVVTGPRQSGKTTLLKSLFSRTHAYISFDNPDARMRAKADPIGFIENNPVPVIFDEIQYVPELLSCIKVKIDEKRKPGGFILTGSQNFVLMKGITESLAGRAAVLSLLPFSYAETIGKGDVALETRKLLTVSEKPGPKNLTNTLCRHILRGGFPEPASKRNVDRQIWCGSYISTYLERDVRNLAQVGDLRHFELFLKMCAIRTGQLLNLSDLARDIGITVPTAKRWLSILETGYLVYLLPPYFGNQGKRLIKSPKIYFGDTGLASYLLGLHDVETLKNHPEFGNLFETMIITDFLKRFLHFGEMPRMYFLRTHDGLEVDLLLEMGSKLHLFEIKSVMTIYPQHAHALSRAFLDLTPRANTANLISQAKDPFVLKDQIRVWPWSHFLRR